MTNPPQGQPDLTIPHPTDNASAEIDALLWTNDEERDRARRYHRIRRRLGLVLSTTDTVRQLAFVGLGGAYGLETLLRRMLPNEALVPPAFAIATSTATFLLDLPASYFAGHRIEHAFGLTKQPSRDWLRQRLLGFAMGTVVRAGLLTGMHTLIRRRPDDWWVFVTAAVVPVSVLASPIFTLVIMPRFNTFTPLADEDLVARLQRLGERAGVPVADVFVMDMSRQTERANAMFTGIGRTRRIVLGDTLTRSFEPAEVEGVIAHELGHQVNRDIWTLTAIGAATVGVVAATTHRLTRPALDATHRTTGIHSTDEVASLSVLGLVAGMTALAVSPLPALVSRIIERRTDRFAMELTGDGETYARAMARLGRGNLVDPDPPRWRERLLSSHPAIVDRIGTALAFARSRR